jgi:hypothetical protein
LSSRANIPFLAAARYGSYHLLGMITSSFIIPNDGMGEGRETPSERRSEHVSDRLAKSILLSGGRERNCPSTIKDRQFMRGQNRYQLRADIGFCENHAGAGTHVFVELLKKTCKIVQNSLVPFPRR